MTRPRMLLDCDPGIDDAFAIFCALRHCDLAAVTTVSGNVPIEHTTRNARFVVELAGASTPVHRGAGAPLEVEPAFADRIHGPAGLGSFDTPEPAIATSTAPATEALAAHVDDGVGVIVATGPLTNIAEAVLHDATFAGRVSELYWMGGSRTVGNTTEHAEFNAWADPHAVDVVFGSGIPITMFGLDLTHQVRMTRTHAEHLERAGTATSVHAADFLRYYEEHGVGDGAGQPMHDPCAVLGLTHRDLFDLEPAFAAADTHGVTRGRTNMVDESHPHAAAITVATKADAPRVIDLILDATIEPH